MSDYQAIYDAVRSRISGGNIGEAVRDIALQAFDISHMKVVLQQEFCIAAQEMQRPCVLFKPTIQADGDMWTVLLGPDPQVGIFATGATPAEAMAAFDQEFYKGKPQASADASWGGR
ncbi:hypothetical protein H8A97_30515 [Bradyrhizobium sp. Arg62]|uniref:hypothetical protein n=1 Tax=Bradyrhizobium brasilense TaxID=1419277 RepID=UPI001E53D0D6|nr:hypothetical protein [Bradyrhizobium brasilense]MCC8949320.1 hypothetical protein [Bradyrhizobium brasilense]